MALIKEDGSIVPGANTYVLRAEAITYALDRGITLPDTNATDAMIFGAMDYLAIFDAKWKGEPVDPASQSLAWPRKDVYLPAAWVALPDDIIPGQIVRAQCELILQINKGVDLLPTVSGADAFVTREKVDVIETEYSEAIALELLGSLPDMPLVNALLEPLMVVGGRLRTVRV